MLSLRSLRSAFRRFALCGVGALLLAGSPGRAAPADPPSTLTVELGPDAKMEFVRVPAGTFVMGSDPNTGDGDETPQHRVTFTHPFYLGRCEVTQQQWVALMGGNPSHFHGASRPVESVSWNDGQRFLAAFKAKTGRTVALPTEAQWEYACRAGSTTTWFCGDDEAAVARAAWIGPSAGQATHPVGTKPPNAWGLCDLCGNVWEWCADWYGNPYPAGDATNPVGPATGSARVLRGGAWGDDPNQARSGYRNSMGPDQRNAGTGFRCVLLVGDTP